MSGRGMPRPSGNSGKGGRHDQRRTECSTSFCHRSDWDVAADELEDLERQVDAAGGWWRAPLELVEQILGTARWGAALANRDDTASALVVVTFALLEFEAAYEIKRRNVRGRYAPGKSKSVGGAA